VPPTDEEWAAPYWERNYPKHRPVANILWEQVVESTGHQGKRGRQRGKPIAKYGPHPRITLALIEQMEMAAVRIPERELPRVHPTVRAFWSEQGEVIGAIAGEETKYIYVEWDLCGAVHGRPMTKQELISRGMQA
jgi:hypothetical protein